MNSLTSLFTLYSTMSHVFIEWCVCLFYYKNNVQANFILPGNNDLQPSTVILADISYLITKSQDNILPFRIVGTII